MKKPYKLQTYFSITLLIALLSACSHHEPEIDPPEMWGQLTSGPYNVGFKTLFIHDASRLAIPYSDWDGKLFPTAETQGRQMQINIWYPSKVTAKNKRLDFEHYVNLMSQQTDFSKLNKDKIAFANGEFLKKTNALGGNGAFSEASLDSLKKLKTNAFLEAEAIDIAYQNRNSNVDCVISLDGGLISSFEQRILKKTPFYNFQSVDVPILAIYAPHPSIDPEYIFDLKHSDRYFFHFPQMSEFHFLNFGQFERFSPNIIGKHDGDVGRGHELASLYSLKFLKAFLTEDMDSKVYLEQSVPEEYKEHIDTAFIKRALPKVPEITSIKNAHNVSGFQYIDSIYWEYKKTDPAPFSKSFYSDMKDWLAWQKDPEFNDRYALYKLAYDSYPNSAETNYYLGYFALETKNLGEAKSHMIRALSILEENGDSNLTIDRKERLVESLKEFLAEVASLELNN